ncbi:autotransporter outer membrane beta-barrel domain-containing protein [Enterobacteriaceae bacterium C34A]
MNKIYTTVWCDSRQQWVVTSELTSGSGRPKMTPKKSALALLLGAMLLPAAPVMAVDYVDVTLDGSSSSQQLNSGDTATSTTINSGGQQEVLSGGTAIDTTINTGGQQHISSGGTATDTTINSGGGQQLVSNGGTASGTTISGSHAVQAIYSGGTATNTTINHGGHQFIYGGGSATGTTISGTNAFQVIYSGGTATNTTLSNSGGQVISGGTATDTTINSAGRQYISSGGTANQTTINGGSQYISNGGTAIDTTLNGGNQYVYDGGTAIDTTLNRGVQSVKSGGTASETTISSGGLQYIEIGGNADGTSINYGGAQAVSGGTATNTSINKGGRQSVYSGGTVTGTAINNEGIQFVERGGTVTDTVINNGGIQFIKGGGAASQTNINDGIQLVSSDGTATDITINGGQSWIETGALADGKTLVNTGGELLMEAGSLARDVHLTGGTLSVTDLTDATTSYTPAQIDKLTMSGGNVSFLRDSDGDYAALNISELSGNGNFLFNTSLAERNANFVTIEQGTGNFGIAVTDSGIEIADHDDLTVNLIHDQGGNIDFEMVTVSGQSTRAIDGGTYMYTLHSSKDKDGLNGGNVWYLGQIKDEPGDGGGEGPGDGGGEGPGDGGGEGPGDGGGEGPGDGGGEGPGDGGGENPGGGKPITTPATDAILAMSNAGLNVIHTELDGLRTYRAGLDKTGPESNVWGHYLGSNSNIDTSNGAAYQLSQNGMEIGADTRTDFARGSLITGAFMSYSDNKVKHARGGSSKIDSYGLGLYGTWFDASGFYADGVIKGNRLSNRLSAVMTNGGKTSGDWNQYAFSTAIEGGYQFDLRDDMSLTPYTRLEFVQMTHENVKLSNGMKGDTGTPRSVTGEAGAKLAGKFSVGSAEFKPYLSAAVVQEFADSNEVTINGRNRFDNNVKGTSGKYGLGASMNVGKDVTLYGEANYRQGSHTETPVQGVAGIRIGF